LTAAIAIELVAVVTLLVFLDDAISTIAVCATPVSGTACYEFDVVPIHLHDIDVGGPPNIQPHAHGKEWDIRCADPRIQGHAIRLPGLACQHPGATAARWLDRAPGTRGVAIDEQ
jgi:hypothetical protein